MRIYFTSTLSDLLHINIIIVRLHFVITGNSQVDLDTEIDQLIDKVQERSGNSANNLNGNQ